MELDEQVATAIYQAIDDVNAQLPAARRLKKEPGTVLFGREEGLDSLGLVNLVVALERHIESGFGRAVSLSDPEVLFEPESPFSSIRALGQYVAGRLQRN